MASMRKTNGLLKEEMGDKKSWGHHLFMIEAGGLLCLFLADKATPKRGVYGSLTLREVLPSVR